ncbi:MAG: ATP phosphoribosyltransferase regulatory subunit [Blastocatellia bacterium]
MSSLTKIPAGVQYFFDAEARLRRFVEQTAMAVFAGWSYDEIILPMFDYHDLFERGMGAERAARTFRFTDHEGALLALRPELTSLVARTVATRFVQRPRPVRLSYTGEVFRYDEPTQRAAREFHQIGVEHIGEPAMAADLEILLIVAEVLTALGIQGFRVALSHVDFFNGIASRHGMSAEHRATFRELIERRRSFELDAFLREHAPSVESARRAAFIDLTQLAGKFPALARAREILINETSLVAIDKLEETYRTLDGLGLSEYFDIDLGDTGGQEYYTGLTFRVFVPGWGVEVGGGGRYDNLIENFGRPEPAVGFSLSLDGLAGALSRAGAQPAANPDNEARDVRLNGDYAGALRQALALRAGKEKVRLT